MRTTCRFPLSDLVEKRRQIICVMVNMCLAHGCGGHMDCAHAHLMGRFEIAHVIFEHCGGAGNHIRFGKNDVKGLALGFWAVVGMFDAKDRIKTPAEPTGLQDPFGVGGCAVGLDDPLSGQRLDPVRKQGIGLQLVEIDVMDIHKERVRVDVVIGHQPGKRGAVIAPVVFTQLVGLVFINAQRGHHVVFHLDFDLIKQPHRGMVERIVQVKDPVADMSEVLRDHGRVREPLRN